MTFDDAMLIAYADGELSPIEQTRVEQAMAGDPALAERVSTMVILGERVRDAFAPIASAPVPDTLSSMLANTVVPMRAKRSGRLWFTGLAVAASLVLGVGLGTRLTGVGAPIAVRDGTRVAAGPLAHALDTQLASTTGDIRVLVSFHGKSGYCRVFASTAADGIACRNDTTWQVRQTRSGSVVPGAGYRQAASVDAALMAAAQDMMVGAPLDAAGEQQARAAGWR